jgi:hypothetical protein
VRVVQNFCGAEGCCCDDGCGFSQKVGRACRCRRIGQLSKNKAEEEEAIKDLQEEGEEGEEGLKLVFWIRDEMNRRSMARPLDI